VLLLAWAGRERGMRSRRRARRPPDRPRPEYGRWRRHLSAKEQATMGLFDKAMKTANELAGKAETMLSQSGLNVPGAPGGDAARLYHELGRLVHEEHRGAPAD